jgi:DNA-binding FadR family transcriptional regulator
LLSEIVYWFRPFREERELKQKFAGETLHLSYKQIEDRFGLSRKQAREALHRLEAADLITIEERGKPAPENSWRKCIFIDLNAPAILEMERLRVLEETDRAPEDT